jgi:hypothetical protein
VRTALITVAHGRHDHLQRQGEAIGRLSQPADQRIVVAIDDPEIAGLVEPQTTVVSIGPGSSGLPLAAARNAGAYAARAGGAELLIFLDVDCLPGVDLVKVYAEAATQVDDTLLCGPVAYLPPPPPPGYDLENLDRHPFHAGRPAPPAGVRQRGGDHRLFWSLSFAVTGSVWDEVGGFCERYQGYGAEDTDFAMLAQSRGVDLTWVGGAAAYHQWHPTSTPPLPHLDDLLRNGRLFAERWGWWPMEGWFDQFAALGLVRPDDDGEGWIRTSGPTLAVSAS